MSILIKGMEIPTSCFYCPFRRKINPDDIQCLVTRDVFEETFAGTIEMRNRGFCPLIEVSPHHGRLIDADALEYHADNVRDPMGRTEKTVMWEKIKAAPTVIPADNQGGDAK